VTARRVVVLRCDECAASHVSSSSLVTVARAEAARLGWGVERVRRILRDVCIGCRFG
jgi:hypothetical protein